MAVLKAVRQLGSLARISVYNVFAVLVVTIPLYYLYGETAIVPSLFLAQERIRHTLSSSLRRSLLS